MRCLKVQPVGPICTTPSCDGFPMAKHYCSICKLFDDERYDSLMHIILNCDIWVCQQSNLRSYFNLEKLLSSFRAVYHCPFCNLCRVGEGLGIDYFHCMTCNCCLGMKLVNHKCLEKSLETNCPICCEFLFTSSETVRALPCGHYMHSACFQVCSSLSLSFSH